LSSLSVLFQLKLAALRNTFRSKAARSKTEIITLSLFVLAAGAGLFLFFYSGFRFFKGHEPFGPILINETFYLFNFALFVMLFISSGVSSYVSLFESKEVSFLITRPVRWSEIYFIKLIEVVWYSSWSVLFIVLPFMAAYGLAKDMQPVLFALFCLMFYIPFVCLSSMLGMLAATILVWLLPGRNQQRAALFVVLGIIGYFLMRSQPEFIKEQGSLAGIMTGYLPHVAMAKNPLLPSFWLTQGILSVAAFGSASSLDPQDGIFYFLVLLSNALFYIVPIYAVSSVLYPISYLKAQDHGETRRTQVFAGRLLEKFFDLFPWPSKPAMAFLEKDIKTFSRNPAEWSQLIIFFGLLLFYFLNLRNLQFHVLKSFWKHLVFALNTIGTYIVLSSFSMRFVFPMLSLEGNKAWMIGSSPIRFSSLLLEKFMLGTFVSMALTLPLVFLSGWMLEIPLRHIAFTVGLGFLVCTTLTGLSVGFGAKFIDLKNNNPAAIISGFGGSILLVSHLAYLAVIGAFLILSKDPQWLIFWTLAAGSLLAGALPIQMGIRAMQKMEF
jgi:ABC-2 type transport system permease protein